ncbi:hypothetical protein WMY93_000272 [Mugilogobius chulae]|uniref:CMP-N-acetylneuraminate-beta-1,4-galactoside alpha-2,3-sialyltransferase n=1 Tax=Mugilogobius chulae TaxID=88201 RepID=A0AAW0PYU6_9GOBI
MKPTHKLLFVLCPMLVVGFIYYSSGKLHLHVWGQKSQIDMMITCSRILPVHLICVVSIQMVPTCKPKGVSLSGQIYQASAHVSGPELQTLGKVNNYMPPFGFKTQERIIDAILTVTKNFGLGEELDSLPCKRCIIVGNGGILANKSLGSKIDEYDVVIRLNEAPVSGYGRDVGTKTTMRITYPEGAIQKPENYEKNSLFVFSAFKPLDFKWLRHMVFKEKLRGLEGFWKSVAYAFPGAQRDEDPEPILHPGGGFPVHRAALQQWRHGQREHSNVGDGCYNDGAAQLRRGSGRWLRLRHEHAPRASALLRDRQDVRHQGVLDPQHIERERVPPKTGEGQRHHRPDPGHLTGKKTKKHTYFFRKTDTPDGMPKPKRGRGTDGTLSHSLPGD